MGLVACVRRAPRPYIDYIDALPIRAIDMRDDVPLAYQATRFPHGILSRADLAGADVAVIELIPVVNEPRHFCSRRFWPEVETHNLGCGIDLSTNHLDRRPLRLHRRQPVPSLHRLLQGAVIG